MSANGGPTRMALIASQGTLDWAYPPFILASTGAALDMEVAVFFTFYGLPLLMKDLKAKVAPHANPAMPMKMPFGPEGFQKFSWPIPNFISDKIVLKEISIRGAIGVTSTGYKSAIDLIESGRSPIEKMHTHNFGLRDAELAIRTLAREIPGDESIHSCLLPTMD